MNREGRAVGLEEALLDRDLLAVLPQVCEDGISDERAPSPSPAARYGMKDLMAPGERPEIVAALRRGAQEADPRSVDGERVGRQGTGGEFDTDRRIGLQRPHLACQSHAALGRVPKAAASVVGLDVVREPSRAQPYQQSLRPAEARSR